MNELFELLRKLAEKKCAGDEARNIGWGSIHLELYDDGSGTVRAERSAGEAKAYLFHFNGGESLIEQLKENVQ